MLTIEDLSLEGKVVFLRVDINTPLEPKTGKLMELNRIQEATVSIRDLSKMRVVVGSHQGRAGRDDFIPLKQHAEALSQILGKQVKFADDIFGPYAIKEIDSLKNGEVLLLDNLRFEAEENMEFTPKEASQTILVQKLYKHFDACVLDAFPTAHRAAPSIIGFSYLLPTCAGRLVSKELKALNRIVTVSKAPFTTVLGGAKVTDRLEAIDTLIANKRADKVLLCGLIANVFLKAARKIEYDIGLDKEDRLVEKAAFLMADYPDTFELPVDVAVSRSDERVEILVSDLKNGEKVLDIGSKTIDHYSRIIRSSGTVFMSGPPGLFEDPRFGNGTESLLRAMASSFGTTIVSGGHLSAALERFGIKEWIDHVSTAGGALVLFLAGKKLPLIEALENYETKFRKKQ
ncbi:MAG TPA: phosphoglycerate kinase [Nitrososphaerales archaeon]|nr:phosphoglycerate kinase [Nitrososphaerales archaeon]